MKWLKRSCLTAVFLAVVLISLFAGAFPEEFPSRGDDGVPSLGTVRIYVADKFRPLMYEYPGYNHYSRRLDSPILYDTMTVIGRSGPHLDGDPFDVDGDSVGTALTLISDAMIPLWPDGFEGPSGTREVHTEVYALNMTAMLGMVAVRAGIHAPDRPMSPGEVESKSGASGDPSQDFPAESFFDVFVEMDLPDWNGFPGGTLYNTTPLLVYNETLTGFPPRVVYIHCNSSAVPVMFLHDDPGGEWQAGEVFGHMVLAGHGISFDEGDIVEFEEIMSQVPEMPTAVGLASCIATGYEDYVKVQWTTASEIDNAGFNVHRGLSKDGPCARINDWLIPAEGSITGETSYSFIDGDVLGGITYYYWVEDVDLHGNSTMHGPVSATPGRDPADGEERPPVPKRFYLEQNRPNPFNPMTEIKYELPVDCHVKLDIYNILGQKVATLVNERQTMGYKTVRWETNSAFASGIYLYRLQAGDFVQTRKMALLR
jgi:hypothetical protein